MEGSGEGAVEKGAAHAHETLIGNFARGLDELSIRPGDVASDVVFAEVEDGSAGPRGRRLLACVICSGGAGPEKGCRGGRKQELLEHSPLPRDPVPAARPPAAGGGYARLLPLLHDRCLRPLFERLLAALHQGVDRMPWG